LSKQTNAALNDLKSQLLAITMSSMSSTQLKNELEDGVLQLLKAQNEKMQFEMQSTVSQKIPESPFLRYELFVEKIDILCALFHALLLTYANEPKQLGLSFASRFFEPLPQQFILDNESPRNTKLHEKNLRWISINKILLRIRALNEEFERMVKDRDKWLCETELRLVTQKWDLAAKHIFNEFLPPVFEKEKNPTMEPSSFESSWNCLQNYFRIHYNGKLRDMDNDIDLQYVTATEFAQVSFRNICKSLLGFTLLDVIGDGNCFYRAVIKYLWPHCPPNSEYKYSLLLRELLNRDESISDSENVKMKSSTRLPSSNVSMTIEAGTHMSADNSASKSQESRSPIVSRMSDDPYKEFVIDGLTDAKTMLKPGVWADHLQVKKLADYLHRPVWLIRFDDPNLILDYKRNILVPGKNYRIGHEIFGDENPIILHFIPEKHYEVLKISQLKTEDRDIEKYLANLSVLVESFSTSPKHSPLDLASDFIGLLFKLEQEGDSILEIYHSLETVSWELKPKVREDMCTRIDILKMQLFTFKQLLDKVGKTLSNILSTIPHTKLYKAIIDQLVEEDFKLVEKWGQLTLERTFSTSLLHSGQTKVAGPLSEIYEQINFCEENKFLPCHKYPKASKTSTPPSATALTNVSPYSSYNPQDYDYWGSSRYPSQSSTTSSSSTVTSSATTTASFSNVISTSQDSEDLTLNLENVKRGGENELSIIEAKNVSSDEWLNMLRHVKTLSIQHACPSVKSLQTLLEVVSQTKIQKIELVSCHISTEVWELLKNKTLLPDKPSFFWLKFCSLPRGADPESAATENRALEIVCPTTRYV